MEDADLYRKVTSCDYMDRFDFLKECSAIMQWKPDGKDSLLDIGCAGGDFTSGYIQSILPKTFSRLVGVDISESMVNYASKHFGQPNISFDILDIGGDVTDFLNKYQRFDHITSTLCLHLVPDQKKAIENISSLLTPDGDCLLYTIEDWTGQKAYKKMFRNWSEYMEDVDDFISPYAKRVNSKYLLKKHLKNAGFPECNIQERVVSVVYNDFKHLEAYFKSVSPFYNRIPDDRRDDFMRESLEILLECIAKENNVKEVLDFKMSYTMLAAYARK